MKTTRSPGGGWRYEARGANDAADSHPSGSDGGGAAAYREAWAGCGPRVT
jgi:hypothetical protein